MNSGMKRVLYQTDWNSKKEPNKYSGAKELKRDKECIREHWECSKSDGREN